MGLTTKVVSVLMSGGPEGLFSVCFAPIDPIFGGLCPWQPPPGPRPQAMPPKPCPQATPPGPRPRPCQQNLFPKLSHNWYHVNRSYPQSYPRIGNLPTLVQSKVAPAQLTKYTVNILLWLDNFKLCHTVYLPIPMRTRYCKLPSSQFTHFCG